MRITDEQKERAAFVNLPQFLMAHGFDLKKVGREYVWKDHDSLHIKDNGPGERGAWFRFSEDKGGDNIGFLREYMGMSFVDAVEALTGEHIDRTYTPSRTYEQKPKTVTARELSLAEADNARRVFAYLCKTRGLDYDMVSALVRGGSIAQEEKTGNVLFKYYDEQGKVIGAEKVGTSTEQKFKGIATGSAAGHGFEVVRGTGEKAFFFESAIDMLSYLQMHDKDLTDCRLVSMMGVKPNIVLDTMLRHNISPENVSLCSDNDTAGNEFAQRLQEQYPDMKRVITPDTYKDWNDMLRGIPKAVEHETEKKEVQQTDMQRYGNEMWHKATDNRDKSLVTIQAADFARLQEQLDRSGINYYAYARDNSVIMAINDKDVEWFKRIAGTPDLVPTKSNRPYSPPEKNIFGSAEYRYIPQKEYLSADRDLVLKMAEIMKARGMQFSGRVYPSGKGTLTVSHADLFAVRNIRDEVVNMRKQFASPDKAQEVGNRDYRANRDTHYYLSKLTPEQFREVKPFLETSVSYHAVVRDGKVAFAVDKENAPAFHRALENAVRETNMLRKMAELGLPMEQNIALSPVVHRLAVEDMQLDLADFFDRRYDEAQFGEMLSLVNAYLDQPVSERYGEHSKLNDMLEAKSSFDRTIELSDFFSQHDFSEEQKSAIATMFVGEVTRGQIDSIDETFTAEDIQAYDEILHNALQESDIADFLAEHAHSVQKQADRDQALADAFASHKDMQLSGSGDDLTNFRLHYDTEINNGEGGYNLIADRTTAPLIKDMSISVLSDDISFDTFKDFLSSHNLAFESVIDTIVPEKQATEEEVLFSNADLARFLAEHTLSSDEWESMAYPLFERGYLEKHQPSDKSSFGYHLPEKELYALAERYHQGEDIRRELALGLMIHASDNIADKDRIEFVFEDGKISDRTYYYAENLRHSLHLERTDDGYNCSFGGMERFVSLEEIGQAFLDRTHEEFEDLAFWWVRDDMLDAIPDISDEKIVELLNAFDGAALHGWEAGDNQPKLNRIKKALHDILGDEVQTEKAFAIIAKKKYNVTFESERKPDSLEFQFGYSKDGNDRWFTESGLLSDFAEEHGEISFALANALMEYLDDKQHKERMIPDLNAGYYKKTNFEIRAVVDGQEFNFSNRFDIGDGKGSGGGSLIDHIRTICENAVASTAYPYNTPESKETPRNMLNVLVPFLEAHSELTAEEQKILDDFKEKNPIRTIDDVEKAQGKFQIYQLPSGDEYHGIRFESMEQLKKDGIQLNKDDYELVYEGIVGEFRGNATLEALYTQFNTAHPDDFTGHSLSVSDVIVISDEGKDIAYFCDSFGFTEMPEFFREKELSLRDIVDRFFSEDTSVIETPDGEWRIAEGGYDLVAEIYHNNTPVCGIINAIGGYEVNAYQSDADIVQTVTDVLTEHGIIVISSVEDISEDISDTAKVSDLAVGDIIMYDGSRREIEEISADRIKMKDLDAPDYGGILIGTSDVLAYDGWQQDMEEKGFAIISKAEKSAPVVDAPEQAEPEDKGPVSLRKVGDFYEMYGKNAEIGVEVLGLRMLSKNGQPMVGFPNHVKDEYSDKLRESGYSVLIEQAFELNPPKSEPEKLQTLQQVVDKFFGTDCESAETEGGTWKLAITDGEKVGELFYGGEPVCGIYNRVDKMEIEPYRELTTFPALLRTAMLEHNPDKPVEIMDFQRTFETPLDKAKWLINDFCETEYCEGADFSDLHNVGLAFTTLTDDELPIQVTADLVDFKITHEFDSEVYNTEQYDSIEDMIENGLTDLDFSDLVSVPDEVIERHTGKDEQTVDLMSDAADAADISSPAEDVPSVTLKYKGDAESLDEIKDKALFLGATVIIDNAEGVISIDTYENHKAEIDGVAYELGLMAVEDAPAVETPAQETADIDKPLFTDEAVIDEIQRNENADVPFWEMPEAQGEQLSLFGDPEPLTASKPAPEKPKSEFAKGPVVDGVQVYEALAAEIDRGTGFVHGKLRVQDFYEEKHPTIQQLADFLKKEYGTGGHSGEGKISLVDYNSQGITFSFENGEKFRHSWYNVATMTESRLKDDTYLSAEQKAERAALKAEKAEEQSHKIVEVGDRFRHKITGKVSEVISLTGALPFYSDDCTVTRESSGFAVTENISYDKLLNSGMYEYIGKAEPEKEQSAPVKPEKAEVTPDKPEIPTIKNLSQLKKAIQPGMMFEISDHLRPESIGERRVVTAVNTVDFTSRKLDENGEPTGKDLHMDFDHAKNWTFDGGELTSHMEDGSVLMSFHFIDSLEREQTIHAEKEPIPLYTGEWAVADNRELFREIVSENERFAKMASEVIGNGKNPIDSVKALVGEFGMERAAFLTALNIVAHPGDGRFYPVDKEWACKVLSPYLEVSPDEVIHLTPEKEQLFERMINGGKLYSIHNTHLAEFAETLMPEYEKYLEKSRSAEKTSPELSVGDHLEYKGKEYKVESIDMGGFITLADTALEDAPRLMSRVTFLTDEFIRSGEYKKITPTVDAPAPEVTATEKDDALSSNNADSEEHTDFSQHDDLLKSMFAVNPEFFRGLLPDEMIDEQEQVIQNAVGNISHEDRMAVLNEMMNGEDTPEADDEGERLPEEKSSNFAITDDSLGEGGSKAKFRANVDAIRTLKTLEAEKRSATAEEKETLSHYVGWGAIPQAFDKSADKWSAEYKELSELLTPEEYRQARSTVGDAFYTSPTIIEGIYEALGNFGFEGGNVLEPAMGVGNFFGCMPKEMQDSSHLYGVEIDSISGRIAQALYPNADISIQGFEKNRFQNGCFDVAVGNVPFGELGFRDTVHDTTKLHDYFFAEALLKLKDGGIMAFVTSAGTLDKRDETTRQMLADKADFIGAIRLPGGKNGAFHDNAGTDVTTDIIFLKKHDGKSLAEMSDIPDWVHIGETADGLPINKYFEQHPDMVLGTVVEGNKLYGSGTMVVAEDGFDLKSALHEAVGKLSAEISHERGRDVYAKTADGVQVQIPSKLRNYSFFLSDDQVFIKKNNAACEFRFDKGTAQHKRFKAFIELRDLTRELIEAMELDKPDSVIKDLQAKLNTAYDDFYKKFGLIHSQTNKRYFAEDVSYNLVAGLEKSYDKTKLLEKSDIFTKRTIVPPRAVERVDTALEALTLSIAEKARVDFEYMSSLTGMTEDELKHDLVGEIFKIPHTENTYQTASEYLSGDIRAKLREAEEIAEYDADFNINVSALKQAMPEPLKAGDIDVKLGATWLDPKYYEQFMYELLQTPAYQRSDSPSARWNKSAIVGVEYSVHANSFHVSNKSADRSVLATQKYGTHKMNAYDIFEHLLNLQEPKVYKTIEVPDGLGDTKEKRVVDIDATRVVQRKADDIRKAFKAWIFKDPQRREAIVERYNELFNSIRPREFDGSALSFPMMNSDIHLHDHQKNAIAHAMFGGNTLFAHCVGAGKTFEMIATAMESKRLGLCTKSLFAVPNHLTEQIGDDFQKLYPGANILVATKKDFKKENRQQLFAKIATGNYDAVIIGHSQLGKIPVSKERQVMTIQSQIDDILRGIEELKKNEGSRFQIKAMERTRKSLQKQLDKLQKASQDDMLTFEQLGIDRLFVDEAHECTTRS